MTPTDLATATDDQLNFMRSSYYRGGTDADVALIDAEIARRKALSRGDTLREEIERIDLAQMDADADGPLSGETAAALARIRSALRAQVTP